MLNKVKKYLKKIDSEFEVNHSYVDKVLKKTNKIFFVTILLIGLLNVYSYFFAKVDYGLTNIMEFDYILAYVIFAISIWFMIYLTIYFMGIIYHKLYDLLVIYLIGIIIIYMTLNISGVLTYLINLWLLTAPAHFAGNDIEYLRMSAELLTVLVLFLTLIYTIYLNNKNINNSLSHLQEKLRFDSLPLIKAYPIIPKREIIGSQRFNQTYVHARTYLYGDDDLVKIHPLIIKNIGNTSIYSIKISSCTFHCEPNHTQVTTPEVLFTKLKGINDTPLAKNDKLTIGFGIDLNKVYDLIKEPDEFGRLIFTLDIHLMDINMNTYEEILSLGFYYKMHNGELKIMGDYINIFNNTKLKNR